MRLHIGIPEIPGSHLGDADPELPAPINPSEQPDHLALKRNPGFGGGCGPLEVFAGSERDRGCRASEAFFN